MPVGTIDHQHIDAFANQALGPLVIVNADGGAYPQPALPIFAGIGEPLHHVDVFDRDQASQCIIFVNQQKFLDLFCHQNLLSFLKRYGPLCRHQVLAGHDLGRSGDRCFPETADRAA